ncbi:MAG: hypothetical protein EAZ85_02285 [Bacteroidetes bacterium]|nr:MAG: hypothetical protein EAZ85_02285 [Bacteroidota bacterium]TAG90651.1 MAG: hypothetical protein EAZ20_03940 [Bacteroidota bacterium]
MKKIIIGLIAFFTFTNLNAQTEKGTIYVGGTFGVNSRNQTSKSSSVTTNEEKRTSFFVIPDVGYFFADNMAIGLGIGYANEKVNSKSSSGSTENTTTTGTFSINPTFRYYMPTSSETFKFFIQARANLDFGTITNENKSPTFTSTSNGKTNGYGLFISPNLSYFPTRSWSIDIGFTGIGYSSATSEFTNTTNNTTNTTNISGFQLGVNSFLPTFGVRIFIGKK